MNEKIKRFGELFKEKREEMHLSLKEVENATSIRMNYLQAIENGSVDSFLSPVYARGFIKQYASFLGYDGEKIIRDNPDAFKAKAEPQEFSYGIGTLEVRNSPGGSVRWLPNIMWIGVSAVIIFCAWYFAKMLGVF